MTRRPPGACIRLLLLMVVALSWSFRGLPMPIISLDRPHSSTLRPPARSLLSLSQSEDPLELVASLNGTIHLADKLSGTVLWSFSSGATIYSSYQAPFRPDHDKDNSSGPGTGFFLDYGDDWQLYAYLSHSIGMKLPMNIEDFVKITPHVSEDGSRILGSKRTAVFVLEAKTGRLIESYKLPEPVAPNRKLPEPDTLSTSQNKKEGNTAHDFDKDPLVSDLASVYQTIDVMRTDYELETRLPNGGVSWSMKVAVIDALFLCRDAGVSMANPHASYDPGSEIDSSANMLLPCQSRRMLVRREDKLQPHSRSLRCDDELPQPDSSLLLPSQPRCDYSDDHPEKIMLRGSGNAFESDPETNNGDILSLSKGSMTVDLHDNEVPFVLGLSLLSKWSIVLSLIAIATVTLLWFIYHHHALAHTGKFDLIELFSSKGSKRLPPKKRKNRKSANFEMLDGHMLGNCDQFASPDRSILDLNKLVDHYSSGHRIGKMFVSTIEIAKGSNGTVVLEGIYEGRPVAVKRLVRAHHDVAFKEIQNLIASDTHPNIVRWYGVEYDKDFIYLSLERCTCNLDDLIQVYSDSYLNQALLSDQCTKEAIACKLHPESASASMKGLNLWKANGQPSPQLLTLMRDMVSGLVHLHELGIIHRDLKPQNVLVIKERSLCAKLSDMGISKRLLGDMSSLGHPATGCGSSGWQAPEQLLHGRQTRAVDLFSLGCVLFFCITGGRHPFGECLERDVNIVRNQMDLFLLEHYPEAHDLISCLLSPNPDARPKAPEVLQHPMFWSSETRLSFLRDTSDRVELEDRTSNSNVLKALEGIASIALGGKWGEKMEPVFINNIGHYRRYSYDSVRDLLRVLRNKLNHYRELPKEIQELVGPVPEGYDNYFTSRFPKLLIEVYNVVCHFCREEEWFQKYFKSNVI